MRIGTLWVGILLAACASTPFPQVRPGVDPRGVELFLLAYHGDSARYLVLERTLGATPRFEVWVMDPIAETRTLSPLAASALPDLWRQESLTPAAAIRAVRESALGRDLESRGYVWPEVVPTPTLTTQAGTLRVENDTLQIRDAATEVSLALLSPGDTRADPVWLVAPDSRRIAVSLRYNTMPAALDLRLVDMPHARALILSTRASEAHASGAFERAAALWYESLELAPQVPETLYNLACAHARLDHVDTAMRYLGQALVVGGTRFRAMARVDADLEVVRGTPRFREVVGRMRPGRD